MNTVDDNHLKNAEMTLEDDYDSIDGIINNGSKKESEEKIQERLIDGQHDCPFLLDIKILTYI